MAEVRSNRRPPTLTAAALTVAAFITAFPLIWMLTTSLKPLSEARSVPPRIFPMQVSFDAYIRLFTELDFGRYLVNTIVVVLIGGVGLFFMAMAGFAFAKHRFRGQNIMFLLILATMMIPAQVSMIPTYLVLNSVGLTGTLVGIALPSLVSAFGIFLFRQFMTTVPDELLEAARIDGCGEFRTFLWIVLPLSKPILAVQAVLTFIAGWNSFLWPLVIANDQSKYTLSVGLSLLNQQLTIDPPLQMAGAAVMVLPILLVFAIFQKYIVQGFVLSGIK
jgi:multiple sugar transport system permease protein